MTSTSSLDSLVCNDLSHVLEVVLRELVRIALRVAFEDLNDVPAGLMADSLGILVVAAFAVPAGVL